MSTEKDAILRAERESTRADAARQDLADEDREWDDSNLDSLDADSENRAPTTET